MTISSLTARLLAILTVVMMMAVLANPVAADSVSPLQVIMDGREAAKTTNLTEDGVTSGAQAFANVVLYVFGFLAILFTALALKDWYYTREENGMHIQASETRSAMWKLFIAGLMSIPAIFAAIVPYLIGLGNS